MFSCFVYDTPNMMFLVGRVQDLTRDFQVQKNEKEQFENLFKVSIRLRHGV